MQYLGQIIGSRALKILMNRAQHWRCAVLQPSVALRWAGTIMDYEVIIMGYLNYNA